jgi:hypothetical protein
VFGAGHSLAYGRQRGELIVGFGRISCMPRAGPAATISRGTTISALKGGKQATRATRKMEDHIYARN